MSDIPEGLKYTKTHEWVKVDGEHVTLGITDYAQRELSDIVYVELPKIGKIVNKGDTCGTIEAVKAVADFYSPLSGEITEVNASLTRSPDLANKDPYNEGWMIKMRLTKNEEIATLLSAAEYRELTREGSH